MKSYNHAKQYDRQICKADKTQYSAPFVKFIKEDMYEYRRENHLLSLMKFVNAIIASHEKIANDSRYTAMRNKINADIAAETNGGWLV